MIYYQKLDIENFEVIIDEILRFAAPKIPLTQRYLDANPLDIYRYTPKLFCFLRENFHKFPILFRFYNSPPYYQMPPHIDNHPEAENKIGFNIPLLGTKDTTMNYYSTPDDNLRLTYTGFANMPAQTLKDYSKLTLLASFELDKPTLVRTDIIHDIVNQKDSNRLILGMKCLGTTFEEVYKFKS
jgi:hypothetical protein